MMSKDKVKEWLKDTEELIRDNGHAEQSIIDEMKTEAYVLRTVLGSDLD
jgi:hypothetical protein